ncbi:MAG: hypothetical protein JW767_04455, partial [Thermoleophilia bacterium]|nr:hypothetical protein [Thermoleophilia bacterium]
QPGALRPVRRFGAGDCGCLGHLIRLHERPSTATLGMLLVAAGGGDLRPVRPAFRDPESGSDSH